MRTLLLLLLLVACNSKREPPPVVVVPPVVVPEPEPLPPIPEPPLPVVNGDCLPGTSDSVARRWIRELAASGKEMTTYWYDATSATTVEGIDGRGCLAGYKVNNP